MKYNCIADVFDAFKQFKVLIIGDVMVDAYIYGSVERISPEAPVPIMHVNQRENRLGGAANVALNIQALGAEPVLCSIIGDDLPADTFRSLLKERGMSDYGIINSSKRITTVKNRVISGGHHLMRIDEEENAPLNELDKKSLIAHIRNLISECQVVIIEDYDKGTLDPEIIEATVSYAKKRAVPVAVDPKKKNFLSYHNVTLFKPNLKELKEGLSMAIDPKDLKQINQAVDRLQGLLDFDSVLVTFSDKGIFYRDKSNSHRLPAHVRSISDVSGAGDTVISIAALCLVSGVPTEVLAELANLGGGIVCEYSGVAPIKRERLLEEARRNQLIQGYFSTS